MCPPGLEKNTDENGSGEAVPAGGGGSGDSSSPRRRACGAFLVTRGLCGMDGRTWGACWPSSPAELCWGSCWSLGAPCGIPELPGRWERAVRFGEAGGKGPAALCA